MLILKSVAAGVAAASLTLALLVALWLLPLLWRFRSTGSGGIGAVSAGLLGPMALAALAFVAGFVWMFRRG